MMLKNADVLNHFDVKYALLSMSLLILVDFVLHAYAESIKKNIMK